MAIFRPQVEYVLEEAIDLLVALEQARGHLEEEEVWTTLLPAVGAQEAVVLDELAP